MASTVLGERSESAVQLNVKTLDSQLYTFGVDKNMPVSAFKQRIADEIGLPVAQQRLIFRGKVLKDEHLLSEYHVENGDTLHLVARQPAQSQPSASASSGETDANNGNDTSAGGPRTRVGHISHSVVLGTLNVGEQGEGGGPDISRVIGAVLNSFGIGGQPATTGTGNTQSSMFSNAPRQTPQGDRAEGAHSNVAGQNQTGNQAHAGDVFSSQQFHHMPQVIQIPLTGAATPIPSLLSPIPDSLSTLVEFMNRMQLAFPQTENQTNSPTSSRDLPAQDLPSTAREVPSTEALSTVIRQAQRLLNDHTVSALSHVAGRLEVEGASNDPTTRRQIQSESMRLGIIMQHLGALFLELGRTALTLRMGQTPTESFVNAGPAVYISSSGPNPIMVQPFPLQTSSLFGGSGIQVPHNLGTSGPVGVGNTPRNISIHIHAGTGLGPIISASGFRETNQERSQGDHGSRTDSGNAGPRQTSSLLNAFTATMSGHPTVVSTSDVVQPDGVDVSISRPPADSVPLSTALADLASSIRNMVNPSVDAGDNAADNQMSSMPVNDVVATIVPPLHESTPETEVQKIRNTEDGVDPSSLKDASTSSVEPHVSSTREISLASNDVSEDALKSSEKLNMSEAAPAVPLGLGLGGLQPKAKSRQLKSQVKNNESGTSGATQNPDATTSGQQILQSLVSHGSGLNSSSVDRVQGSAPEVDPPSIMSRVIHSPALNGLLSGVSEQSGVGSPNMLRNMLEQFSQSPVMRNAVNQIAQQVDSQDVENMFSGLGGGGQEGGFDLSRIVQQMMPIVSRALSGGGTTLPAAVAEPQTQFIDRSPITDGILDFQTSQTDLRQAAQRIVHQSPPADIFRAVAENAGHAYGDVNIYGDLVDELCSDEDLTDEFMQMLRRDVSRRIAK